MRLFSLSTLVAGVAAAAVVLGVVGASAQDRPARRIWRPKPMVAPFTARLEDGMGNPLPTFMHRGQTFVLGEPGDRFVIVVNNPTAQRVEAVVSVDGRDAITGRVASLQRSRGYVVPAFGSARIDGFRQSLDHVAAFRFTSPSDSYSARMGTPQNVGVIGVAFFPERAQPIATDRPVRPMPKRSAKSRAPRAGAAGESDGNLGTGWGETRESRVVEVPFVRQSNAPARIVTLRYDDEEGLLARGIEVFPRPVRPRPPSPVAFPDSRFAPPPP